MTKRGMIARAASYSLLACATTGAPLHAEYNANIVGVINSVLTYDDGLILFTLANMPSGPCSNYFIIPASVPVEARQMLLSRALVAKGSGEQINIGYDNSACINGWFRAHRIG